eukprot:12855643-Alexandrium_andersonii.AAC.1
MGLLLAAEAPSRRGQRAVVPQAPMRRCAGKHAAAMRASGRGQRAAALRAPSVGLAAAAQASAAGQRAPVLQAPSVAVAAAAAAAAALLPTRTARAH